MPRFVKPLVLLVLIAFGSPASAQLLDYVKKPEPKFAWKLTAKTETPAGIMYDIELTSQEWQKLVWTHQLQVYQPTGVKPNATMLVYNTGGKSNVGMVAFGMDLAKKIQAPVAILYDIPNQPIFDKKEDALIAETFVRFLETKDGSWPLLFPMAKSVVKSMDALQAFSKEEWKQEITGFIVSGASKRGWTSWLTGAVDPRVTAIAPLVIDTLSMDKQLKHQKESFGEFSVMIHDYVERGLAPIPETGAGHELWQMVDPIFYRDKLTMPKLLINGNNDPYWTTDALNIYWNDLKGDKYVTYVPNAGHNLSQGKTGDRSRTTNALAAFARAITSGQPLPKLEWKHDNEGDRPRLSVKADSAPKSASLWVAHAPTTDFRKAEWKEIPMKEPVGKEMVGTIAAPGEGYVAFYGALDYEIDGIPYTLSTQIRIVGKDKK